MTEDDLRATIDAAADGEAESNVVDFDKAARRLANLPKPEYDRIRRDEAKKLKVRPKTLDDEVEKLRREENGGEEKHGRRLELPEVEPWPESVDGAALIGELQVQLRRFVAMGEHDALAAALWIIHAHGHEHAFHSPRLAITSPSPRCGKSTLLRCIGRLTPRPLQTSNISPSAMFRIIEACSPTLLVDEVDQVDEEKKREIVGIVNSSHCRLDACVIRTVAVGDDHEPRAFSTWAPIALAAIGRLPATWVDRSITIKMQRRAMAEPVERMRLDQGQGFNVLARKTARWVADHGVALAAADPEMPVELNDRAADNWRQLTAIADLAGGRWPAKAREAALELSGGTDDSDVLGVMLLADLREIFEASGNNDLWTETLLDRLKAIPERPWAEMSRGKGLSAKRLADLLRQFGIRSKQLWNATLKENHNGYSRDVFTDAWSRYCAPISGFQSSKTLEATATAGFSDFQSSSGDEPLEFRNRSNGADSATSRALEDCTPGDAENEESEGIPFVITRAMKSDLHDLGWTADDIRTLTPQDAHDILKAQLRRAPH